MSQDKKNTDVQKNSGINKEVNSKKEEKKVDYGSTPDVNDITLSEFDIEENNIDIAKDLEQFRKVQGVGGNEIKEKGKKDKKVDGKDKGDVEQKKQNIKNNSKKSKKEDLKKVESKKTEPKKIEPKKDKNIAKKNEQEKVKMENIKIEQPKKKKKKAVGFIVCLFLVLAGAVATFLIHNYEKKVRFEREQKSAQESAIKDSKDALEKYLKYISEFEFVKMYEMVDNATKAKRAQDNFIFVNQAFYKRISLKNVKVEIKSCKIMKDSTSDNKDKYNASNTTIDYKTIITTDGGSFSFDSKTDMVKEEGEWHVVWKASMIYPEYEPMDEVKSTFDSALRGEILDRNGKKLATVKDNVRVYPQANAAAHLVGFVSKITSDELKERESKGDVGYSASSIIGKKGLEYAFERELKGAGGQTIKIYDSKGNEKCTIMESDGKLGKALKTTIDMKIQNAIYEQIKNEDACSVAINPYTGEILAMVSTPSYDNNGVYKGTSSDTYNKFARSYCPGSTFKPITGAIGLDSKSFTADTNFGPSSKRWRKDSSWGNLYVTTQHQCKVGTLINGITMSDNVYFAKAALRIGATKMKTGLDKIGFNKEIPFEMNFNPSQYSNSGSFSSEAMLANSGYGQGQILVNPLHLATIYSSFVNGGNMVSPVFKYDGETKYWIKNAFSKETSDTILKCLVNVVKSSSGTGHSLYSSKVVIGGKTGTAEIKASQNDKNGTELGWFVALTPEVDKKDAVLIVTMVENVKNRGGSAYVVSKTKNMLKKIYSNY